MGTLVGNKPPDTLEEWRVSRESPRAAVTAKDPQLCVQNAFSLSLSLGIPWLVPLPDPARSFGLFKAHILGLEGR